MGRQGLSRVVLTIPWGAGSGGLGLGEHSRGAGLVGDEDTRGQGVRAGPGDVVRGGKAAGVARPAQPRAGSRHTGTWPGAEIRPLSAQQDGPRGCGDQRAGSVSGHPVGQPLVRSPRRPPWMPWTAQNGDAGGTDGNEPHSPSLLSRGPCPSPLPALLRAPPPRGLPYGRAGCNTTQRGPPAA